MKFVIGTAAALICLLVVIIGVLLMRKPASPPEPMTLPARPAPETTVAPASEAPEDEMVYKYGWVGGRPFLYPRTPLFEMKYKPRRWEFRAGSVVPGLEGMKIDDAVMTIISTYPGVTTRVVDQADSLELEVRRDRITIIADLFTRRVVSARVG
jgi:hypothetical protein